MVEVTQEDMHQAAIAHDYDDWPAFWLANGARAQKQARHFARHRTTALAAKEAELAAERAKVEKLRAMLVDDPHWICAGIPDDVIEAGIAAFDKTQNDLQNYVSGQTTDWDEGMICAAIFKAMTRAALTETQP